MSIPIVRTYVSMYDLTHHPLDKMAANLADDIFKCIFLIENDRISIKISLKFVPRSPIDNKPALFQVMALRRIGDKPLPDQWLPGSPTHMCGTRGRWINSVWLYTYAWNGMGDKNDNMIKLLSWNNTVSHLIDEFVNQPVVRLNIKTVSYQYCNSHYKDKTVPRPSYLYNGNPIPGKTVLYWDGAQFSNPLR